jgi:hypothetical protein
MRLSRLLSKHSADAANIRKSNSVNHFNSCATTVKRESDFSLVRWISADEGIFLTACTHVDLAAYIFRRF